MYLGFQSGPVPQCKKVVSVNIRLTALFGSEDPTVQLISTKVVAALFLTAQLASELTKFKGQRLDCETECII